MYQLEILSNKFGNLWIFLKKNRYISNSIFFQNFIVYYFFFIFWRLFSLSPIHTCQKHYEIFCSVLLDELEILSTNFCFFNFLVFLTFSFLFHLSILVKKFWKFLWCFILWIRDFIEEFFKIMEYFSKQKYIYLKSKIHHKFHPLLFVFYFFNIFDIFFSISPILTCPKILQRFKQFTNMKTNQTESVHCRQIWNLENQCTEKQIKIQEQTVYC